MKTFFVYTLFPSTTNNNLLDSKFPLFFIHTPYDYMYFVDWIVNYANHLFRLSAHLKLLHHKLIHNNHLPHFCILKIRKITQYIIYDWKILTMITSYRKKYRLIKLHNIGLIMKFLYNNNFIKFIMWYNKFVIIKSIEKSDVDIALCSSSHQSK